jgi:hypothetical protein
MEHAAPRKSSASLPIVEPSSGDPPQPAMTIPSIPPSNTFVFDISASIHAGVLISYSAVNQPCDAATKLRESTHFGTPRRN